MENIVVDVAQFQRGLSELFLARFRCIGRDHPVAAAVELLPHLARTLRATAEGSLHLYWWYNANIFSMYGRHVALVFLTKHQQYDIKQKKKGATKKKKQQQTG
jgi:hypothetical protein